MNSILLSASGNSIMTQTRRAIKEIDYSRLKVVIFKIVHRFCKLEYFSNSVNFNHWSVTIKVVCDAKQASDREMTVFVYNLPGAKFGSNLEIPCPMTVTLH